MGVAQAQRALDATSRRQTCPEHSLAAPIDLCEVTSHYLGAASAVGAERDDLRSMRSSPSSVPRFPRQATEPGPGYHEAALHGFGALQNARHRLRLCLAMNA